MDRLICELEGVISDLSFRGTAEAGNDIKKRLELACALCRELGMTAGEQLCGELIRMLSSGDSEGAVKALCTLGCYTEIIRS